MALSLCCRRALQRRTSFQKTFRRHGYIVLVPEIGEDLPEKNPLLQKNGLPEFSQITIENCMAAIGKQTLDFESDIKQIEEKIESEENVDVFKDVFEPIEKSGSSLDMTWGLSKTLYLGNSTLMPTKSYLAIHERARRARAVKFNSPTIYNAVKKTLNDTKNMSEEELRVVKKFALEGKLNGLDLNDGERAKLTANLNNILAEKSKFKIKNEHATKAFNHQINDPQIIRGFPEELLKGMVSTPSQIVEGPWFVTLQPHISTGFMEYCPDRILRWNVWQAIVSRGSGYKDSELQTSPQIEEIRFLRRDQAKILGYSTFADMSMETKMAGSVTNVKNMLSTLLERAKPAQDAELANLYEFASKSGFEGSRIELWDVPYWRRKQRISQFCFTDQEIQEYFPLPKVLKGMFNLCERLFNITIRQRNEIQTWHKDVKYYDIFETHSSAPVAGFYFDPYARESEKIRTTNNGWMVGIQNHSTVAGIKPLAALIFNFTPPTQDKPTLLYFNEVSLLFHKFGHALQHLMSRTKYSEVSGSSNIEWDAVEVCGHVLSHWLYNEKALEEISSHYKTEEKIPSHIHESLTNIRKHTAGIDLCRELYLSALDIEFHSTKDFWLDIVKKLWPQYRSFPLEKLDSHPCSFTQIFIEEWGAAYFSHIWSRIIAADIYSAFHEVRENEDKVLDVGKRFRETYLALGGSCHPGELFRKFRGRDPSPKALLSSLGLKKIKKIVEE
nr:probable cytosolic oligopeptidase A [Onthophagus taurus]